MGRAFWCPKGDQAWFAGQVVVWAQLNDVYGSAEGVPALLAAAEPENAWEAPVWEELSSRLYHQGTVAPRAMPRYPHCVRWPAGERRSRWIPRCSDHVYLELEGSRLVAADPDGTSAGMAVRPAVESGVDAAQARLLTLTRDHGQEDVATQLLQLFGSSTCPSCGMDFEISSAFV